MKKAELMRVVENSMLLGKTSTMKGLVSDHSDPLSTMANGATDMMMVVLLDRLTKETGLTREDFAENSNMYDELQSSFDILEKMNAMQKEKDSAE